MKALVVTGWRWLRAWVAWRVALTAERMADGALDGFFICDECMEAVTTPPALVDVPGGPGLMEVCPWCKDVLIANCGGKEVDVNG